MLCFFFQAEDGIRDLVRSRGLGDVYKRQAPDLYLPFQADPDSVNQGHYFRVAARLKPGVSLSCLLYTSDAADERSSVDLGGRRIIKKKKSKYRQL